MKRRWIDVSVPLATGMVNWPGDPPVSIEPLKEIAKGGSSNVSAIYMGAHTGTHMDAPRHFFTGGRGLDTMPLDATIGPARVIAIRDRRKITAEELRGQRIRKGERILFKTHGSGARWRRREFDRNYVYISPEAARYLAARGVRTVGVDYLSVGGYKSDGAETHRALLGAGVWIIEGLNLAAVEPGQYDLICLPLRILNSDGAPARAVVRRKG
ncbi:MAG: cyclase family protein [Bryobacteraceae bacterium]